jgi:hypothetical protein
MSKEHKGSENLVPQNTRTKEKQREIARMGGVASGESKRQKKTMREWLEIAMQAAMKNADGQPIMSPDDPNRELTRKECAMLKLAAKAANGDLKAIELSAKLSGEAETKVVVETATPAEKLAALINESRKKAE